MRVLLSLTAGIPEQKLRVIAPDVGGGFGSKLQFYREECIAAVVALELGRPVKWVETRSENAQATHHGRDQLQEVELAVTNDGKILGMRVDLLANMGAYMMIITPGIPILGAWMYHSIYKMEAYDFTCTGVFTTTTPTDAYRGAGRPEATYAIERLMDDLAAELGVDPLELRKKNWIEHHEFPYDTISGMTYDSGNYEAATAKAVEMFDYDGLRAEQAQRRGLQGPGTAGHRHLDLHRDVRPRPVAGAVSAEVRRRRLGARDHPRAAHRQGRGGHRHVAARPGARHRVEPDRLRRAGRRTRRHHGHPRRHR